MDDELPALGRGASIRSGRFECRAGETRWTVDVDYFDVEEQVRLYRDGRLIAEKSSPAVFDVPSGRIEAEIGEYGMRHVRLVQDGASTTLEPVAGTGEAERAAFARRHPRADRALGVVSWVVLVGALLLELPELVDVVMRVVGLDVRIGLDLPWYVRTVVVVLGVAAGIDRGLRMKHNALLDD